MHTLVIHDEKNNRVWSIPPESRRLSKVFSLPEEEISKHKAFFENLDNYAFGHVLTYLATGVLDWSGFDCQQTKTIRRQLKVLGIRNIPHAGILNHMEPMELVERKLGLDGLPRYNVDGNPRIFLDDKTVLKFDVMGDDGDWASDIAKKLSSIGVGPHVHSTWSAYGYDRHGVSEPRTITIMDRYTPLISILKTDKGQREWNWLKLVLNKLHLMMNKLSDVSGHSVCNNFNLRKIVADTRNGSVSDVFFVDEDGVWCERRPLDSKDFETMKLFTIFCMISIGMYRSIYTDPVIAKRQTNMLVHHFRKLTARMSAVDRDRICAELMDDDNGRNLQNALLRARVKVGKRSLCRQLLSLHTRPSKLYEID